jgi:Na+-driven multidrug efflux pump
MGCRVEPAVNTSLGRELLRLVLPALLMQVVQTVGWLGEAVFVSRLGKVELAAIGLVGEITWLLSTLTTIVTVSATTLVAQRWGAGDLAGARGFHEGCGSTGSSFRVVSISSLVFAGLDLARDGC